MKRYIVSCDYEDIRINALNDESAERLATNQFKNTYGYEPDYIEVYEWNEDHGWLLIE